MRIHRPSRIMFRHLALAVLFVTVSLAQVPQGTSIKNAAECTYEDLSGFQDTTVSDTVVNLVSKGFLMQIDKSTDADIVLPGDTIDYQIDVSNSGTIASGLLTIRDTLPPGVFYIASEPLGLETDNIITWSLPAIQVDDTSTIHIRCVVDNTPGPGSQLENSAWVHYGDDDSRESNLVIVEIGSPEITILKTVDLSEAIPGDMLNYVILVENTGNTPSTNTTIKDTLPENSAFISASDGGVESSGIVTWTDVYLPPTEEEERMVSVKLLPGNLPGAAVMNIVQVTNDEGVLARDTAVTTIDEYLFTLNISKESPFTDYSVEDTVEFLIILENPTVFDLEDVLVTDTLPSDLAYLSSSDGSVLINDVVVWDLGTMTSGSRDTLRVYTTVNLPIGNNTDITNAAYVTAFNTQKTRAEFTVTIFTIPEFAFIKSADSLTVPGDTLVYTLTYTNLNSTTVTQVVLTDSLSDNLQFISTTGTYNYSVSDHIVVWDIGSVAAGITESVVLLTKVKAPLAAGTGIPNKAIITSNENLPDTSVTITIVKSPLLTLTKTANISFVIPDDLLHYTLMYTNAGDTTARNVVLTDTLPPGVSYKSSSGSGSYDAGSHVIRWDIGDLKISNTGLRTIVVTVNDTMEAYELLVNLAAITSREGADAFAQVTTTVLSAPDLTLTKEAQNYVLRGDTLEYTLYYSNSGLVSATQVMLLDTLPLYLEFISATGDYVYTPQDNSIQWSLDTLAGESSNSIRLTTRTQTLLPNGTQILNTAFLTSAEGYSSQAEALTIVRAPVLELSKHSDSTYILAGNILTYSIVAENLGDTTATGIVVIDTLPPEVTYISSTGAADYDENSHVLTWGNGEQATGLLQSDGTLETKSGKGGKSKSKSVEMTASQQVFNEQLSVRINTPIADNTIIFNRALITCNEGSQDTSLASTTVISKPYFDFLKTGTIEVYPGDTLDYTITYVNTGTDDATVVVIRDTLPPEVQFISATEPYDYQSLEGVITWDLGTLVPGQYGTREIRTVSASFLPDGAQIVNTAWISSDEGIVIADTMITSNILPISLNLTPDPRLILGNGTSSALLNAAVYTFLGNPVPDGLPVAFSSDRGTIPAEQDTNVTLGGIARSVLISDLVTDEPVVAIVNAKATYSVAKTASDTTAVTFGIGAFDGTIYDYSGKPVNGALVELIIISDGSVYRTDTTGSDGYYILPVSDEDDYQIHVTYNDAYDNPVTTVQDVEFEVPNNGEVVTNTNSISGWLYDEYTGAVINEEGIMVILSGLLDSTLAGKILGEGFSDTTLTDSTGMYFFTNLDSGLFALEAIYNGVQSYSDGALPIIDLSTPGLYVVAANILLHQTPLYSYKIVDRPEARPGDILTYTIYYGSNNVEIDTTVFIVDHLPTGLSLIEETMTLTPGLTFDSYNTSLNEIRFSRYTMTTDQADSIIFQAQIGTKDDLLGKKWVNNISFATDGIDTSYTEQDARSDADTKIIYPVLSIKKNVNRRRASIGDLLTYTIALENISDDDTLHNLVITDIFPRGFKYNSKRSYWESQPVSAPSISTYDQSRLIVTWTVDDTLRPGEVRKLKYRSIIGLASKTGENDNIAYAAARTAGGTPVVSNETQATVIVDPGVFSDRGLIIGKVFYDLDGDNIQNGRDIGLPDVELIMQDGTRVVTDEYGKYSIPNVRSGSHVLRLNEHTLPSNTKITLSSADFLGDQRSRLVRLSPGGFAKANFTIAKEEQVNVIISKVATLSMTEEAYSSGIRALVYKPFTMVIKLGFLSEEAVLRPEIYSHLYKISQFLKWQPHINLAIRGHTDTVQPPEGSIFRDNMHLSLERARNIKAFLANEMGIDESRITSAGFGETLPIASNATVVGRKQNRRVELIFSSVQEDQPQINLVQFKHYIDYTGGIPLDNMQFHEVLPVGFTYAAQSARLDGIPIDPIDITENEIVWDLENPQGEDSQILEFGIVPADYRKIKSFSTARSYIEFTHSDGVVERTDSLQANISALVEELTFKISLEGAHFDVNSSNLKSSAFSALQRLGEFMVWQPDIDVVIDGFTDNQGTLDWNMVLSKSRANSVRDFLVDNYAIDPQNIVTRGFGPEYPVEENSTPEGQYANRRVEALVNSTVTSEVELGIKVVKKSLKHNIESTPELKDVAYDNNQLSVLEDGPQKFRLFLDIADFPRADMVELTLTMPDKIQILDEGGHNYVKEHTWNIPIAYNQDKLWKEFSAVIEPGIKTLNTLKVKAQLYRRNRKVTEIMERTITVSTE